MSKGSGPAFLDNKRVVVFDFDGVLADSVEVKTDAFAEIYSPYGEVVVKKVIDHHRAHGGVTRFEKFRYYHGELLGIKVTDKDVEQLSQRFSSLVVEKVVSSPEIPGAPDFLSNCVRSGMRCAINSATPEEEIRDIVVKRGWGGLFCCIYGSPCSKTKNLLNIIQRLNVSPSETVFFGDADSDLQAAKNNSIDFVGIGPWMAEHYGSGHEFPVFEDFLGLI